MNYLQLLLGLLNILINLWDQTSNSSNLFPQSNLVFGQLTHFALKSELLLIDKFNAKLVLG